MKWTDERFEALKAFVDQGYSASQIGNELGVTRNAVIGKVHRGGLMFRVTKKNKKRKRVQHRAKPQPMRPIGPVPIELPPENPAAAVSLVELAMHHCRWPVDHLRNEFGMFYCGADQIAGSPYCARHHRVAHQGRAA